MSIGGIYCGCVLVCGNLVSVVVLLKCCVGVCLVFVSGGCVVFIVIVVVVVVGVVVY